jgi:hypothetical protein
MHFSDTEHEHVNGHGNKFISRALCTKFRAQKRGAFISILKSWYFLQMNERFSQLITV